MRISRAFLWVCLFCVSCIAVLSLFRSEDAIHFAVALHHYGLLRTLENAPSKPSGDGGGGILLAAETAQPVIKFTSLLRQYAHKFAAEVPVAAVDYLGCARGPGVRLALLAELVADNPFPAADAVRRARWFSKLVGTASPHGVTSGVVAATAALTGGRGADASVSSTARQPGSLWLVLPDDDALEVVRRAGADAQKRGQWGDAVELLVCAGEYDAVMAVLCSRLSKVARPPHAEREYWKALARSFLPKYAELLRRTDVQLDQENSYTLEVLLNIAEFFDLAGANENERALSVLDSLRLTPARGDSDTELHRKADAVQRVPECVQRLLPELLLQHMACLFRLFSASRDHMQQAQQHNLGVSAAQRFQPKLAELRRRSRQVNTFAGLLRFNIGADVITRITRMEVMML